MTRPGLLGARRSVSASPRPPVGVASGTGSGGKSGPEPVRSTNLTRLSSGTFAPRSLLSVGVFYMDLTSYIGFGQVTNFITFSQANPQGS